MEPLRDDAPVGVPEREGVRLLMLSVGQGKAQESKTFADKLKTAKKRANKIIHARGARH